MTQEMTLVLKIEEMFDINSMFQDQKDEMLRSLSMAEGAKFVVGHLA
jgi:hypothetical protein